MTSHRSFRIMMALIILLLPATLLAQTTHDSKERANNEKQIAADKRQLARDVREIQEFERMLGELDALREAQAAESYVRINTRLRTAMDRELEQAHLKAGQAAREHNRSIHEKRVAHMEATASGTPGNFLQLDDDSRDLRDDRRDEREAAVLVIRLNAIASLIDALQPAVRDGNADAVAESRRLMGEFLEVLRADLAATRVELGEDRGERRDNKR